MARIFGARDTAIPPLRYFSAFRAGAVLVGSVLAVAVQAASAESAASAAASEIAEAARPSVEVDLSVLDALPPAKKPWTGPRIVLTPPGGKSKSRAAPAPEARPKAPPADAAPRAKSEGVAKAPPAPKPTGTLAATSMPKAVSKALPDTAPKTPAAAAEPSRPAASPAKPVVVAKTPVAAKPPPGPPPGPAAGSSAGGGEAGIEKPVSIAFEAGSGSLPKPPPGSLDRVVRRLAEDEALRIVIFAYAKGTSETASRARRLSFSRALAVRRYLVGNGVRGTRAEIRALGIKTDKEPADRVDLVLVKR